MKIRASACGRMVVFLAAVLTVVSSVALAQTYPTKGVRVMVPFAPGGVSDIVARTVSPRLSEALGQPVIVENRTGAGGVIATELVAKAPADGYTLLTVFDNFAANHNLYKQATYDPVRDFTPIALVVRSRLVMVLNPRVGARTLEEFIRVAKSRGSLLNYATAGGGTSSHLVAELFKLTAGIEPTPVHYKGGAPAITALLGGQVDMMMATMSVALQHVKSGRLTAVAVTSPGRSPLLPGVAAINESYPGFEAQSWVGFVAPAGTPRAVVVRLHGELNRAAALPEVKAKLEAQGFEVVQSSPETFGDWIRSESSRWSRVIRERRITVE